MPELPEVEVIRLGLLPRLKGRQVTEITSSEKQLRLPIPSAMLNQWIKGAIINNLDRRGKYLLVRMNNRATMIIHLGMSGKLGLFPANSPRKKHDHLHFYLDDGLVLRLNDTRRFGSIQVVDPNAYTSLPPLAGLGPEPFSSEFSADYLLAKARGRKQPIKILLMDGRVVAGIGNIYASEILFTACINPKTPASTLNHRQWQAIISASQLILKQAIACGGSTIADYTNSNGQPGYFQNKLKVYGRNDLPCLSCTNLIQKTVMAGRATYHCPHCQPTNSLATCSAVLKSTSSG